MGLDQILCDAEVAAHEETGNATPYFIIRNVERFAQALKDLEAGKRNSAPDTSLGRKAVIHDTELIATLRGPIHKFSLEPVGTKKSAVSLLRIPGSPGANAFVCAPRKRNASNASHELGKAQLDLISTWHSHKAHGEPALVKLEDIGIMAYEGTAFTPALHLLQERATASALETLRAVHQEVWSSLLSLSGTKPDTQNFFETAKKEGIIGGTAYGEGLALQYASNAANHRDWKNTNPSQSVLFYLWLDEQVDRRIGRYILAKTKEHGTASGLPFALPKKSEEYLAYRDLFEAAQAIEWGRTVPFDPEKIVTYACEIVEALPEMNFTNPDKQYLNAFRSWRKRIHRKDEFVGDEALRAAIFAYHQIFSIRDVNETILTPINPLDTIDSNLARAVHRKGKRHSRIKTYNLQHFIDAHHMQLSTLQQALQTTPGIHHHVWQHNHVPPYSPKRSHALLPPM